MLLVPHGKQHCMRFANGGDVTHRRSSLHCTRILKDNDSNSFSVDGMSIISENIRPNSHRRYSKIYIAKQDKRMY